MRVDPPSDEQLILVNKDLRDINEIGRGMYGSVYRATYIGNNGKIAKFCQQIAIKISFAGYDKDMDVTINKHLNAIAAHHTALYTHCNISQLVRYEKDDALISPLVTFSLDRSSANLESFLEKIVNNVGPSATLPPAFSGNELGETLCDIAYAMKETQDALHGAGVFHFDTACRNYLVKLLQEEKRNEKFSLVARDDEFEEMVKIEKFSLVITDFGFAEIIPENGIIIADDTKAKTMRPLIRLDTHALLTHQLTLRTDLYALKVTIIEMLGLLLGKTSEDVLCFTKKQKPYDVAVAKIDAKDTTDSLALQAYVMNISKFTQDCVDENKRKMIQLFLSAYLNYLTTMPSIPEKWSLQKIAAMREEDNQQFLQATELFRHNLAESSKPLTTPSKKSHSVTKPLQRLVNFFMSHPPKAPSAQKQAEKKQPPTKDKR